MHTALARVMRLVSNRKAYAAALTPTILAIGTLLSNWISSGVFDTTELRIALAGAAVAAATGVVTWLTDAGDAEVEIEPGSLSLSFDPLSQPKTWEVDENIDKINSPDDPPPAQTIAPRPASPPTI